MKKEHIEFLFPKDDESTSMTMLQSLLNKIRDNSIDMKNITIKINNMNVAHHNENYQFKPLFSWEILLLFSKTIGDMFIGSFFFHIF